MPTPVAAVNTPRLVTLGLSQALEPSGYEIERVDDPRAWAATHPASVIVISVRSRQDVDLVVDLTADPSVVVVAMLDSITTDQLRLCLGAGARACVSLDCSIEELTLALEASQHDMAVLPTHVARAMARTSEDHDYTRGLTESQMGWLRDLASGSTVRALADRVGFSEREMYRRLSQVYRKMGCSSRTEALIRASSSGGLEPPGARHRDRQ